MNSNTTHLPIDLLKGTLPVEAPTKGGKHQQFSYFAVLFYLLLSSMTLRQNTVLTQSEMLKTNAATQSELNKQDGEIKFSTLPPDANRAEIDRVQAENQEYAAQRQDIQNNLITTRQNASVLMTQTSTNVNILEQDASENSGWLKLLNKVFQVINEMTQR